MGTPRLAGAVAGGSTRRIHHRRSRSRCGHRALDTADRINERYRGIYGIDAFVATLRDQAIPAESIAAAGSRIEKDRVQIMTVHRAKGLQWSRVWVAGLEEGSWPNLRLRGSLLGVQELEELLDRDLGGVGDPVGS